MKFSVKKNFIVILAMIALVGFAMIALKYRFKKDRSIPEDRFQQEITQIETQSGSDEVGDIEKDLLDTDLEKADSELQEIEKELNTTL